MIRIQSILVRGGLSLLAIAAAGLIGGCAALCLVRPCQAQTTEAIGEPERELMVAYLEARLAIEADQHDRALELLQRCRRMKDCPTNVYMALAEVLVDRSRLDETGEMLEEAGKVLEEGLVAFPDSVDLRLHQSNLLRKQGRLEEAIGALNQALETAPRRLSLLETISDLHLLRLQQVRTQEELNSEVESLVGIYERVLEVVQGQRRTTPLMILSSLHLKLDRPERAVETATEVLELDMYNVRAYLALAEARVALGQPEEAIQALRQALLAEPENQEVRNALNARLTSTRGRDGVVAFHAELAESYPNLKGIQELAAQHLMDAERWEQAESILSHIVSVWPDDNRSRLSLVRLWLATDQHDKAVGEALSMGRRQDEFAPLIALSVAESLDRAGKRDAAIDMLEDLYHEAYPNENVMLALMQLLADSGEMDRAQLLLKSISNQDRQYFLATLLLIESLESAKRFEDAHRLLDDLPQPLVQEFERDVTYMRGRLYRDQKEHDKALEAFERLIEGHQDAPERYLYYIDAGLTYQEMGRMSEAETHYRQALELNSEDADTYNTLGYFYAETHQKLDEALELIKKAVDLNPQAGHIVDSLGWVHYQRGDYEDAAAQLEEAVKLRQQEPDPVIYDHLGDAYLKLNRIDDACEAWRKSLELDPEVEAVRGKLNLHSNPSSQSN